MEDRFVSEHRGHRPSTPVSSPKFSCNAPVIDGKIPPLKAAFFDLLLVRPLTIMPALRSFTLLLSTLLLVCDAAAQKKPHRIWTSPEWTAKPLPAPWRVKRPPVKQRDLAAFERWDFATRRISAVIARFGPPDRYSVTDKPGKPDVVIYDLSSGHHVAFFAVRPLGEYFLGGVIVDSTGRLVKLDKGLTNR